MRGAVFGSTGFRHINSPDAVAGVAVVIPFAACGSAAGAFRDVAAGAGAAGGPAAEAGDAA